MDGVQLSVIIPVFNKFSLTEVCLRSLREQTPGVRLEVVVVDNGSSDETRQALIPLGESLFGQDFRGIHLPENINFGPASNLGAAEAHGDLLFFLNNDTILTPGWLDPLLAAVRDGRTVTGPLLMYPEEGLFCDRVQHLGVACKPQLHPCHLYEFFPVTHPVVQRQRVLQFLTGAAMLMPRDLFEKAGGFVASYINGGEDLDLCVQLRNEGASLRCVPESRIYHLQSQTPGRHDHEKHNADVLRQRCMNELYPDLHLHLQKDGYELALDDCLVPFARLPLRREQLLSKGFGMEAGAADELDCLRMMKKEPLFAPAYDRLAVLFQEQGNDAGVAQVHFLKARLFPGKQTGEQLKQAAERAGDVRLQSEGERIIAFYQQLESKTDLEAMARETARYGAHLGQPVISEVYTRWLTERDRRQHG